MHTPDEVHYCEIVYEQTSFIIKVVLLCTNDVIFVSIGSFEEFTRSWSIPLSGNRRSKVNSCGWWGPRWGTPFVPTGLQRSDKRRCRIHGQAVFLCWKRWALVGHDHGRSLPRWSNPVGGRTSMEWGRSVRARSIAAPARWMTIGFFVYAAISALRVNQLRGYQFKLHYPRWIDTRTVPSGARRG